MIRETIEYLLGLADKRAKILHDDDLPDGMFILDTGDGKPQFVRKVPDRGYTATSLVGFAELANHLAGKTEDGHRRATCAVGQGQIEFVLEEAESRTDRIEMGLPYSPQFHKLASWATQNPAAEIDQAQLVWDLTTTLRKRCLQEWFLPAVRNIRVKRTDESIIEEDSVSVSASAVLDSAGAPDGTDRDLVTFDIPVLVSPEEHWSCNYRIPCIVGFQPASKTITIYPDRDALARAKHVAAMIVADRLAKLMPEISVIQSASI